MTRPVDVDERTGNWYKAYQDIREELTPSAMRDILAKMEEVDGVAQLGSYMSLARNVMANDRAAAYCAALLVATGIKPAPMDFEDAGEVA